MLFPQDIKTLPQHSKSVFIEIILLPNHSDKHISGPTSGLLSSGTKILSCGNDLITWVNEKNYTKQFYVPSL